MLPSPLAYSCSAQPPQTELLGSETVGDRAGSRSPWDPDGSGCHKQGLPLILEGGVGQARNDRALVAEGGVEVVAGRKAGARRP